MLKEKALLISLDKGLKGVNLLKDEQKIRNSYKFIFEKYANPLLKTRINALGIAEVTPKKIKKETNTFKVTEKLFNSIVKMEKILAESDELKVLTVEFKDLFKQYKAVLNK